MRPAPLRKMERFYLASRAAASGILVTLHAAGLLSFHHPMNGRLFALGLVGLALSTTISVFAYLEVGLKRRQIPYLILPLDLIAIGVLIRSTEMTHDPFYPWVFGIPIIYAMLLRKRWSWLISGLAAVVYLVVHVTGDMDRDFTSLVFLALKTVALPFVGFMVSEVTYRSAKRERELEHSRTHVEELNAQLGHRLAELHAVTEITEIIHSSLDADEIGPIVLQTLKKAIGLPSCCLFVIDKEKAETLFTVSDGLERVSGDVSTLVQSQVGVPADHEGVFSCLNVLDHNQMMVVFCADSRNIEAMTPEDRLVLQAVAGELAVAVENWQLYKLTKRLAITDELTGLYNYRYLQQRLDDEYERASRYSRHLSLLMIDVDDFKSFNDTNQHVAGDRALADVGEVLRACTREIDVIARYGGEEFSVLLPETDSSGAFVVAEKIREEIAGYPFRDKQGVPCATLTVSIGLATYPDHALEREELLRLADDALFRAKGEGRDRVRSASPLKLRVLKAGNDEE